MKITIMLSLFLQWHQERNVLTNRLIGAVTKNLGRSLVIRLHLTTCIDRDHPIDHIIQDGLRM